MKEVKGEVKEVKDEGKKRLTFIQVKSQSTLRIQSVSENSLTRLMLNPNDMQRLGWEDVRECFAFLIFFHFF